MNDQNRTIIFIHFLTDPAGFDFENPLEQKVRTKKKEGDVLYSLDNFSDSLTLHYAKKLISDSEQITVICQLQGEDVPTGGAFSLLNQLIKKKNSKLFCNRDYAPLKPMMIRLKGRVFATGEELMKMLFE